MIFFIIAAPAKTLSMRHCARRCAVFVDMGNVLLVVHSIRVEVIDFIRKILVEKFETVGGNNKEC